MLDKEEKRLFCKVLSAFSLLLVPLCGFGLFDMPPKITGLLFILIGIDGMFYLDQYKQFWPLKWENLEMNCILIIVNFFFTGGLFLGGMLLTDMI